MIRTILGAGASIAMLAMPLGSLAQAQQIFGNPGHYVQGGPGVPGWVNRPGVVYEGRSAAFGGSPYCIKLCENDTSPCDPIQYKRADMRCNYNGDF